MALLKGKKVLIVGLASSRSIAYGIADSMFKQGAELAFTYQNDKLKDRVTKMASEWQSNIVLPCDVSSDDDIANVFSTLKQHWEHIDILIHSVAFAPADQLNGKYHQCVNREGFNIAHEVSSYSLAALAQAALPMFNQNGGAILTMTYSGSSRVVSNYNVMGLAKASLEANVRYLADSLGANNIRVNAVSAGPIKTLAAAGIKDFRRMLDKNKKITPLGRNTTLEEVGNGAVFLCSDWASGITGEILHVDSGAHIMGSSVDVD